MASDDVAQAADAQLVAAIAEGTNRSSAEADLCRRYQRRIYLYGLRHLRDAAAAADLVQDVLATLLEKARAGAVREPAKLGSFVLGTCRLMVRNRARGETRRARILSQYHDPRAAVQEQPEDASAAPDSREVERIGRCLEALADRERTVLLLFFYAELDSEAVARELGVTGGNVRVIRHRALSRLRGCMQTGKEVDR